MADFARFFMYYCLPFLAGAMFYASYKGPRSAWTRECFWGSLLFFCAGIAFAWYGSSFGLAAYPAASLLGIVGWDFLIFAAGAFIRASVIEEVYNELGLN